MRLIAHVIYRCDGGSGLGIGYTEAMEMQWADLVWFAERLGEYREAEAKAKKEAAAKASRR